MTSTVAGNFVQNVDVQGNAHVTTSGMALHAHLAIYKVCTRSQCSIMDSSLGWTPLSTNGLDVLSSISAPDGAQFNYDLIAIVTF
ncbi:unnamed protein product [Miscanthus lutarioriparius]|uniref:Uncharacterized protein n=1 Tax=Miscanthus lutarioriparius TaxID=422564 RepID=A0A811NE52_9POAL|nr:unnamed protein product [Miscanthus lutarioriparius]